MVEHYIDTVGVTGSNPVSRTSLRSKCESAVIMSGMRGSKRKEAQRSATSMTYASKVRAFDVRFSERCPVSKFQTPTSTIANEINGFQLLELKTGQNHRELNGVEPGTWPDPGGLRVDYRAVKGQKKAPAGRCQSARVGRL